MTPEPDFTKPDYVADPEKAILCLPVFDQISGRFSSICTSLSEFPVYLLNGGVNAFFKALILQQWQKPIDWTFVDEEFDKHTDADEAIEEDELDIVQKRLVMWMKGRPVSANLYELGSESKSTI